MITATKRWDPFPVLENPIALDAIGNLGEKLRAASFINHHARLVIDDTNNAQLATLALGQNIDPDIASELLGGVAQRDALVETGAAWSSDEGFSLDFVVLADRRAMALLPQSTRDRLEFITADVADGLETGTFDFVCVNAPWIPSSRAKGRVYADGGPDGFDLPRRFLLEGASLLADEVVPGLASADHTTVVVCRPTPHKD